MLGLAPDIKYRSNQRSPSRTRLAAADHGVYTIAALSPLLPEAHEIGSKEIKHESRWTHTKRTEPLTRRPRRRTLPGVCYFYGERLIFSRYLAILLRGNRLLRTVLFNKVFHRVIQHGIEIMLGSPINKLAGFCDIGDAAVTVFIPFAVKLLAGYGDDLRIGIARLTEMLIEGRTHFVGEFLNGNFVRRRADIEDLAVANTAMVLDDARNAVHRILDIGVGTVVHAAIDQLDRCSIEKRIHKMAENTGIA